MTVKLQVVAPTPNEQRQEGALDIAVIAPQTAIDTNPSNTSNRREADRKKIGFDALIDFCLTYSVPWNITDLGMSGAFVEMDPADAQIGTRVEFLLRFKLDGQWAEHRLWAETVGIERRGVAFKFEPYDDRIGASLARLLARLPS